MDKNEHGGHREGAGRPAGARNKATIARREALAEFNRLTCKAILECTGIEAARLLKPNDVLLLVLYKALQNGDLNMAVSLALDLMPYHHSRKAPVAEVDPNAPKASDIANDTDPEIAAESDLPPILKVVA